MTCRRLALAFSLVLLAGPGPADGAGAREGFVERRGGVDPLVGTVERIDDAGVHVRTDAGRVVVPWDRVRRVRSDRPLPGLEARMVAAESAWRARIRVERGDTERAEPLLESLFENTLGGTHETAAVVAEGLLRCRIARGAHEEAVIPALEVLRLRRAGVDSSSYDALAAALDDDSGLCPVLAPFFAAPRRAARLVRDLDAYDAGDDPVVQTYARAYRRAAVAAAGVTERTGDGAADDGGAGEAPEPAGDVATWFDDLVSAVQADPAARASRPGAVQRLERGLDAAPRWRQAWTYYALGQARLLGAGADRHEAGALDLLRVPARFGREQPYLAGLALARASTALAELGDAQSAATLADVLTRRWPAHPARALVATARGERQP